MFAGLLAVAGSATGARLLLFPFFQSTKQFLIFEGDTRVRYERGAEQSAAIVARALPSEIATVERAQFRHFSKPVTVYVCASTDTFNRHGFGIAGAGGFVLNGRLFISPKRENTAERLPRLLAHELSHLHLEQQLGLVRYARHVPGWFREGLAVHVSNCGAENVTEIQARDAIGNGHVFRREVKGSLLSPQTGARDGLAPHLYYRQSAMFVAFLARIDSAAFERLVVGIQERRDFAPAFFAAYGRKVDALWDEFMTDIKSPVGPSAL